MQKKIRSAAILIAALTLSACAETGADGSVETVHLGVGVPESVAELAAPGQDLSSARLSAQDGCFWYRHVGPVETTLVPLRTVGGNPICTKRAS